MTQNVNGETVYESKVGSVVTVAGRSRSKPLIGSFFWAGLGGIMLYGGSSMLLFELTGVIKKSTAPDWGFIGIAAGVLFMGYVMFSILIRRLRAIMDPRLYFRGGPGGISVCCPVGIKFTAFLLSYKVKQHDIAWTNIKTWYPFVMRHNGIPTESQIRFEGVDGRTFGIDTMFFKGSRESIVQSLKTAAAKEQSAGEQQENAGGNESDDQGE